MTNYAMSCGRHINTADKLYIHPLNGNCFKIKWKIPWVLDTPLLIENGGQCSVYERSKLVISSELTLCEVSITQVLTEKKTQHYKHKN